MSKQTNILSFDEVKARGASSMRSHSASASSAARKTPSASTRSSHHQKPSSRERNASLAADAYQNHSRSSYSRVQRQNRLNEHSSASSRRRTHAYDVTHCEERPSRRPARGAFMGEGYQTKSSSARSASTRSISAGSVSARSASTRVASAGSTPARTTSARLTPERASSVRATSASRPMPSWFSEDSQNHKYADVAYEKTPVRQHDVAQDDAFDEEEVEQTTSRFSLASLKKKMRSAKAEREFNKTIGASESKSPEQTSRAAVYEMKMGRTHKRSSRMQDEGSDKAPKRGFSLSGFASNQKALISRLAIACCSIAFAFAFLYQPLAEYYGETRQLQKLEAEYAALQDYNQQLSADIAYLSTDEGIEEYARYELGWIRPDEHAVVVEGVESTVDKTQTDLEVVSIPNSSIPTPDTWYSGVLDVVFGYRG